MSAPETTTGVLRLFVQRARNLYSLPAVAVQVLDLTEQAKVDVRALKECIENDPALTAKLLRVVNSSLFGLGREVSDLGQALALLGVKPLKLLVLGFSLPRELFTGLEEQALQDFWRHSLIKSVAARLVTEQIWNQAGDEPFIAGLLQRIGMLVLIQELGEPYLRFLDRVSHQEGDLVSLETSTLGFDHRSLSAQLLEHWKLPGTLVKAVALPHDAETIGGLDESERRLPQILHLAELIVELLVRQKTPGLAEVLRVGQQYHAMTFDQLSAIVEQLEGKVETLAELFAIHLPDGESYSSILLKAHQRLAQTAADAVGELIHDTAEEESLLRETQALGQALSAYQASPPDARRAKASRVRRDVHAIRGAENAGAHRQRAASAAPDAAVRDPGLAGRLDVAASLCRQSRIGLSLVLFEILDYDELIMTTGLEGGYMVAQVIESTIERISDQDRGCLQIADPRFALVVRGCDRPEAVDIAKRIIDDVPVRLERHGLYGRPISLCAGIASAAIPPRNFSADDFVAAAERCLFGARSTGTVKSIDAY